MAEMGHVRCEHQRVSDLGMLWLLQLVFNLCKNVTY